MDRRLGSKVGRDRIKDGTDILGAVAVRHRAHPRAGGGRGPALRRGRGGSALRRRKLFFASSLPACVHRSPILAWRQRLTCRQVGRTTPGLVSMLLEPASNGRRSAGRPGADPRQARIETPEGGQDRGWSGPGPGPRRRRDGQGRAAASLPARDRPVPGASGEPTGPRPARGRAGGRCWCGPQR